MKFKNILVLFATGSLYVSCGGEVVPEPQIPVLPEPEPEPEVFYPSIVQAASAPSFDWEDADWMPTPAGQSRIPTPWMGAGAILPQWGIEFTNDRKADDGWEMYYNTFFANSEPLLKNPFFVLYNARRDILRIFLYRTTPVPANPYTFATMRDMHSYKEEWLSAALSFQVSVSEPHIVNVREQTLAGIDPSLAWHINTEFAGGQENITYNRWYVIEYRVAE